MLHRKQNAIQSSRTIAARRFRPFAALLAGAALAVGGASAGVVWAQGQAGAALREPQPGETIVLDLPAGESCSVDGRTLTAKPNAREFFTVDPTIIRWGKGYRLSVRNAKVTLAAGPKQADGMDGPRRVLIEPRPGTPSVD